ncbi:MAG: hypothetical protein WC789_03855 [Lentisphaeria bacterium]|jgi:hypothetical protein
MPSAHDRNLLRDLARQRQAAAASPLNQERKRLWYALHDGSPVRPMILAESGGVCDHRRPFPGAPNENPELQCTDPWARGVEHQLRYDLWRFQVLQDDFVLEPAFNLAWKTSFTNFGVEPVVHQLEGDSLTARSWEAPLKDIKADFHKLKHRTFAVDRAATLGEKGRLEEIFGDLLPVRLRGAFWWTFGLTIQAIDLIGLENLMLFMYDDPEGLHQLLAFLRDDNLALARWAESEGLFSLNNENDYIGSGGIGYTRRLPPPEWQAGNPVRLRDQWLLLESQETVGVGPDLYREFIFPYHKELAEQAGLVYYGCCEPLHSRWEVVKEVPNLRACSIAPLCNQEIMAEAIAGDYIFSRKPNPTLISTGVFNEELIRQDLRATLRLAKHHGCRLELIMKDVHTLNNEPWRLARWIQLAREEIATNW